MYKYKKKPIKVFVTCVYLFRSHYNKLQGLSKIFWLYRNKGTLDTA